MEKEVYDAMNRNEGEYWWFVGIKKIAAVFLDKYVDKKKANRILDAGCGTGGWFSLLSKYGEVLAVDKSDEALRYARQKGIAIEVKQADLHAIPYSDASFNLVVGIVVLYHQWINDDEAVLAEFYRVLKPGGLLIIINPAYNWLRGRHDEAVHTNHRYHKSEIKDKLNRAGFRIIKNSYVNFFLFPAVVGRRLLEKVIPLRGSEADYKINSAVNSLFKRTLFCEARLIKYINFPFGLSLISVAKK